MRDGAVVALEVVLDADLPVRVEHALGARVEPERVDVDTSLGDAVGYVLEELLEGCAS